MHSHLISHPALIDAVRRLERLGPDQFELYYERRSSRRYSVGTTSTQKSPEASNQSTGLVIRVLHEGRPGISSTRQLDRSSIEQACASAMKSAASAHSDEHAALPGFSSTIYPSIDQWDSSGLSSPVEHKNDLAARLSALCSSQPMIRTIENAQLIESEHEVHLVDSNGEHLEHRATRFRAEAACQAEDHGDSGLGMASAESSELAALELQLESTAQRAASSAFELLGARALDEYRGPLILRAEVAAALLEMLAPAFSASEIARGQSPLNHQHLNERLFPEGVTIVDDGLLPGGAGTAPFDREGTPLTRTELVDGGMVSHFLYDRYHAHKFGCDSTGSAARSLDDFPRIATSNLFLKPGRRAMEGWIRDLNRGLLLTRLDSLELVDRAQGRFRAIASGIRIEDGNLTLPVNELRFDGNLLEIFQRISDIGNDLRFFGSVGAPSVLLSATLA